VSWVDAITDATKVRTHANCLRMASQTDMKALRKGPTYHRSRGSGECVRISENIIHAQAGGPRVFDFQLPLLSLKQE
jgi:hypothetical protein